MGAAYRGEHKNKSYHKFSHKKSNDAKHIVRFLMSFLSLMSSYVLISSAVNGNSKPYF